MDDALFRLHAELEDHHWWFTARREIVRRVVQALLAEQPHAAVLDVGCGTGANLAGLDRSYHRIGVDPSPDAVRRARARFPDLDIRCGSVPAAVEDQVGRVNLALLLDVLEHVEDDRALLDAVIGTLAPGGHVVVTVPADPRLWSAHDVRFGHFRRYTPETLPRVWADLPVAPVAMGHFNARLYPLVRAVRALRRMVPERRDGQPANDLELPAAPFNRILHAVFAGEANRLAALAAGQAVRPYSRGVSLLAVLRREGRPDGRDA